MKKVIIILAALLCVSNLNAQIKCVTPPSGLISWWPGEGNANDIVGSNPGMLQNGATFASGMVGQAFSFDGVNDYIRVADSDKLRPSQLTVEAWVKSSVIPSMHYFIVAKSDQDAYHGYELGVTSAAQRPGEGRGRFSVLGASNTNYGDTIGSTYLLDGNFHHIAGTYDGSALKLYVDGILEALTTWSGPITYTADDLFIGTRQNSYGDVFKGVIDEASLYNRALSAQEIAGIYNVRNAGKCKPVSVEEKKPNVPDQYWLTQNYPNPFNPSTTILYELPRASQVEVAIFNLLGEKIRTLVNQPQQAGQHRLQWDGHDDNGKPVPSGVYFYRLLAGDFVQTRKMILMQ